MPGFDIALPRRLYTLAEMTATLAAIIDAVSPDQPVVLLLHDWGCYYGYQYYMNHPERVSRIIGIDIGDVDSADMKLPFKMAAFTFGYQNFLAWAWRFGGQLGDKMTRWLAGKFNYRGDLNLVWSGMNFGYHLRWKLSLKHRGQGAILFEPRCPMLFLFGTTKPTMFHSPVFVDRLNATPGSRAVGFAAGHWVTVDRPAESIAEIKAWLD